MGDQSPTGPVGGYGPPMGGPATPDGKGFFAALFDFGFNHFVTPKIVKVVYAIFTVLLALGYLAYVIFGFSQNAGLGVVILVVGAVVFILYLAFFRMAMELYYAVIRMSEDVHRYVGNR